MLQIIGERQGIAREQGEFAVRASLPPDSPPALVKGLISRIAQALFGPDEAFHRRSNLSHPKGHLLKKASSSFFDRPHEDDRRVSTFTDDVDTPMPTSADRFRSGPRAALVSA
uniref:Uncharacterized protein n=1 Tax=Branchiostoma floridae TaxID=7739 RepID=C3Y4V7_BRAFL|eukprot:XP_002608754.1 hypothetical protein BRAFLDRAFT_73974 [Branchiostoma floridae]